MVIFRVKSIVGYAVDLLLLPFCKLVVFKLLTSIYNINALIFIIGNILVLEFSKRTVTHFDRTENIMKQYLPIIIPVLSIV